MQFPEFNCFINVRQNERDGNFFFAKKYGRIHEGMGQMKTDKERLYDDIMWETLASASERALYRAECFSFHFPSFIYRFKDGVAKVKWQLNPDGMYYMDEDGFGMTPDVEYNIYGFIDRQGRVLSKFRHLSRQGLDEKLDEMRREARNTNLRNH